MDTRTGLIHEMLPGEDMADFSKRLKGAEDDFVAVAKQPDAQCSKCHGKGSVRRGLRSKRFKPCDCVLGLV